MTHNLQICFISNTIQYTISNTIFNIEYRRQSESTQLKFFLQNGVPPAQKTNNSLSNKSKIRFGIVLEDKREQSVYTVINKSAYYCPFIFIAYKWTCTCCVECNLETNKVK